MSRPTLIERTMYEPKLLVEEFMVPLLKRKIESVLECLPLGKSGYKVLDLGCGGQPFRYLFEKRGHEYVSADAQDPLGIVDYLVEVDKEVPLPLLEQGPFDLMCSSVNRLRFMRRPPGGHLSRAVSQSRWTNFLGAGQPHCYILHEQPYDFWRPTVHALRFYSAKHKLDVITLETVGDSWDVHGTVLGASYDSLRPINKRELVNRLSGGFWNCMFKALYKALANRWFQKRYVFSNELYPVYLSNVALFEKR